MAYLLGLWNSETVSIGVRTAGTAETVLTRRHEIGQNSESENQSGANMKRMAQKYEKLCGENADLARLLTEKCELQNQRASEVLNECMSRLNQDNLMLKALLNCQRTDLIPEFNSSDIQQFGKRAAYQAQLRSPWTNSNRSRSMRPHEELERTIAENRLYNAARGGLPVCTTCTTNGNHIVTGHTADSTRCPFYVHVDPYRQHSESAAELNAIQAATESAIFDGEH